MKLLLALLCIRSAQGFDFVQFAGNGQESGVLYATGFCIEVIDTVWQKYSRRLIHAAATDLEFEAGFGPLRGGRARRGPRVGAEHAARRRNGTRSSKNDDGMSTWPQRHVLAVPTRSQRRALIESRTVPSSKSKTVMVQLELFSPPRRGAAPHKDAPLFVACNTPGLAAQK